MLTTTLNLTTVFIDPATSRTNKQHQHILCGQKGEAFVTDFQINVMTACPIPAAIPITDSNGDTWEEDPEMICRRLVFLGQEISSILHARENNPEYDCDLAFLQRVNSRYLGALTEAGLTMRGVREALGL